MFRRSCLLPRRCVFRPSYDCFAKLSNQAEPRKAAKDEASAKRMEVSNKSHCLQIVRKFDYENFLATLYIKNDELRRTAFALRAFNVELAQVRDLTKSDQLAKIRFQFWLDIIDDIYKNKADNTALLSMLSNFNNFPVAYELNEILSSGDLSKHWLKKLVTIRSESKYLSDFPFQTLSEIETYCDSSVTPIYYLLNEKIVQLSSNSSAGFRIELDHIASHLGKAQGISNILRGIRHNAAYRRCYIPTELLIKHKCTHEDFLRSTASKAVSDAIFETASQANSHLQHCIDLLNKLSKSGAKFKQVFLPAFATKKFLDQLQRFDFNIFEPKLYQKNGLLPLQLWWRSKRI